MLDWTECPEGWTSEGFKIVLAAPYRWLVLETVDPAEPIRSVSVPREPLAIARTLTGAKREAELIASSRGRAEVRRRHVLIMLLAAGIAMLLVGAPFDGNELALLAAGIVAVRSGTILLGTLIPAVFGEQHEVFYQ